MLLLGENWRLFSSLSFRHYVYHAMVHVGQLFIPNGRKSALVVYGYSFLRYLGLTFTLLCCNGFNIVILNQILMIFGQLILFFLLIAFPQ